MRSKSKQREIKYGSARQRADKKASNERGPYLKLPADTKLLKVKTGPMLLDILPYPAGEGNPQAEPGVLWYERTYWTHRGIGANNDSYLCLAKSTGKPCPICDFRKKLMSKQDDDNEDLIKDLAPKERQLFNVINLKEPDKGVQVLDISYHLFGKQLDARIRNSEEDDNWDNFFFLEDGKTLKVTWAEKSFGGNTFNEAETIDFRSRKEDYDEEILEQVVDLDSCLVAEDYEDLKKVLLQTAEGSGKKKKGKPADEDEDDDDSEEEDDEDDSEEEEDEAPTKKKKVVGVDFKKAAKKKADEEDEEDEDDDDAEEDDSDDEEDEEDEPKVGKKSYDKARTDQDEDEEEDDEDDSEEEEDEAPTKKKNQFASKGAKIKTKDEEDEELEDEEDEEDEDDDAPAKSKSSKPASKKSSKGDDDDWDDYEDDDDEEEDEAPAKKKKK